MKKLNKIMLIFLMFGIIFMFNDSKAVNINENYSNAYEKWLNIPDSEKQNYIMPSIYTTNLEEIESINNIQAYGNDIQLPKKYNSTENLNMTVRDQGITNSCWAITSIELFEIANAKKNNLSTPVQYSSRHLDYSCSRYFLNNIENMHGFNRKVGNGANVKIGMAYFASGKGPILETSMPFQNNVDLIDIAEIQNKTVEAQLRDYIEYPNIYKSYDVNNNVTYSNGENLIYTEEQIKNFRNIVKKQIMKTGAVSSFTYAPNNRTDYNYFSNENGKIYGTSYFCNNDKLAVNHSICIVGWDDTYSKDNFKESIKPVHDGAYLVLNSWGTTWNQLDGYYYISYDDYFIEQMLFGIQNISEKNYDNIYQYDELGSDFNVSSSKSPTKIYGANVFNRKTMYKDILSDVGIYINDNNTSVKIYLDNSAERLDSIEDMEYIGCADNLTTGYHVINIEKTIYLNSTFAIIVEFSKDDLATLPVEANFASLGKENLKVFFHTASSNPGESYISENGIEWEDITTKLPDANICIKAFTNNSRIIEEDFSYIKNPNWKIIVKNNIKMLTGINEKTTISDLLEKGNYKNGFTIKAYKDNIEVTNGVVSTGTIIKAYYDTELLEEYTVVIYGDTSGDGNIASVDALSIIKNKLKTELFKNIIFEQAGRVTLNTRNSDDIPSAVDALAIIKHKLKLENISQ